MTFNASKNWRASTRLAISSTTTRRDAELGSIEVGKKADLVAFLPRDGFAAVTHVWVDGGVRMKAGAQPLTSARELVSA